MNIHDDEDQEAELPLSDVLSEIARVHDHISRDWKNLRGWAPESAATLLEASRLDWLASLAHALKLWSNVDCASKDHDGQLILAWANLGSLVEGTMKFFLSVHAQDYDRSVRKKKDESIFKNLWDKKANEPKDQDGLMLEVLRQFFAQAVWTDLQRDEWDKWIEHIRMRRNTIHAYQDREIGSFDEFEEDVRRYRDFLHELTGQLPELPSRDDYY